MDYMEELRISPVFATDTDAELFTDLQGIMKDPQVFTYPSGKKFKLEKQEQSITNSQETFPWQCVINAKFNNNQSKILVCTNVNSLAINILSDPSLPCNSPLRECVHLKSSLDK
jgi:hypothetical protein